MRWFLTTPSNLTLPLPLSKKLTPILWKRLDTIVLQWIYGTISILSLSVSVTFTAQTAWGRLFTILFDNKNSCVLFLFNCLMLVHLFPTNIRCFNSFLISQMPIAFKSFILKLCFLSTRLSLLLSMKKNAAQTTMCLHLKC